MSTNITRLGRTDVLSGNDFGSQDDRLNCHTDPRKRSGYHLIGFLGISLGLAVCLLLQLHKLPDSSLSYSLLNAIVSLLFNVSSSALVKVLSFLISLLGFSRWTASSAR